MIFNNYSSTNLHEYRGCLLVKNSFINISEVNRQYLHSLGTRSEDNFEKVSSTNLHPMKFTASTSVLLCCRCRCRCRDFLHYTRWQEFIRFKNAFINKSVLCTVHPSLPMQWVINLVAFVKPIQSSELGKESLISSKTGETEASEEEV